MILLVLIVLLMGIIGFGLGLLIWPDVAVAKLLLWTGSIVHVVLSLLFAASEQLWLLMRWLIGLPDRVVRQSLS